MCFGIPFGDNFDLNAGELKRFRSALALAQGQLANQLGVRRVTEARWEAGIRGIPEPAARLLERLCVDELVIGIADFVALELSMTPGAGRQAAKQAPAKKRRRPSKRRVDVRMASQQ